VKKFMKTTLVCFALIAVVFCTCKDDSGSDNNQPDYDMTGTYTFSNTGGSCTWTFTADGNYQCSGYGFVGTLSGTWSSSGNNVTISNAVISSKEVFTVQENGNQLTLTLKDNKAPISNVLSSFKVVAKSVTLTKISGSGGDGGSSLTIEMVPISAGTFTMGSPTTEQYRSDDETQHSVTLNGFSMSKYQVTQEQYQAVMGLNPSSFTSAVTKESGTPGKLPVEGVSWYDALVFCNKLSIAKGLNPVYSISGSTDPAEWGTVPTSSNSTWNAVVMDKSKNGYRLPTEAEWEYACRAGTTTAYNTGDTISNNTGWYDNNSEKKTHKVGLKPANAWGLYDMHGNVWEWCWDYCEDYSVVSQMNPTGAVTGSSRVYRGGSWGNYGGMYLRSAYRGGSVPYARSYGFGRSDLGFRLVRS
jgi:formylglycine-generating enzyme required for sulfatase activity